MCVGESLANIICWMQSFDIDFFQLLAELDMLSRGFMLWRTNHGRVDVLNIAFVLNYHVI